MYALRLKVLQKIYDGIHNRKSRWWKSSDRQQNSKKKVRLQSTASSCFRVLNLKAKLSATVHAKTFATFNRQKSIRLPVLPLNITQVILPNVITLHRELNPGILIKQNWPRLNIWVATATMFPSLSGIVIVAGGFQAGKALLQSFIALLYFLWTDCVF